MSPCASIVLLSPSHPHGAPAALSCSCAGKGLPPSLQGFGNPPSCDNGFTEGHRAFGCQKGAWWELI